ncbi:Rho GDP dissociation inhibitor [Malassezia pachydermatis]|uniref:Rho gdp-dissociation inhibitor n=1 Tax=Malassezia pachydermatis TaxID=77020 RepID=A0A0M9VNN2_9BASI|nr:rho gdp-dissociation inhibitor [Malassezia pachydermatis]KOS13542.1 rho gdp-dissociation inhibitor [Malassezia pachydermatis]
MSKEVEPTELSDSLNPTPTAGYNPGEKKSIQEYASLDAQDESLRRWKESLGISTDGANDALDPTAPKLTIHSLALESTQLPNGSVSIQLDKPSELEKLAKTPLQIPEGIEYAVAIRFSVGREVLSGLKYIHVVKRAGVPVDRMEEMIGSYPPRKEPYVKRFAPNEAPSGFLARSGNNSVRSRIMDDDGVIYADFTWTFKFVKA